MLASIASNRTPNTSSMTAAPRMTRALGVWSRFFSPSNLAVIPTEVAAYRTFERRRLSMRPGLTCLWQVSGRNTIGFDDWVRLDLEYIDTWSLANDLRILLRTVPAVLSGSGAS